MLSETFPGGGESGDGGQKLDARRTEAFRLADRVEALKRVERSLLNCKRLGDPELLQVQLLPMNSPGARSSECRRRLLRAVFLIVTCSPASFACSWLDIQTRQRALSPWLALSLQEGCCLAFSVGLPLLGKRHRKHVHRCFSLAAQILQELESPLARLRAQLHLEAS